MSDMIVTREQYMDLIELGIVTAAARGRALKASSAATLRAHALSATEVGIGSFCEPPHCPAVQAGLYDPRADVDEPDAKDEHITDFAMRFDSGVDALWRDDQGRDLPDSAPTRLIIK